MVTLRKSKKIVAVAAACLVAIPAAGGTAHAQPGGTTTTVSSPPTVDNTPAPNCVKVIDRWRDGTSPHVAIRNDCRSSQRVKVIWAYGSDSECIQLVRGRAVQHGSGAFASFDGIARC